MIRSCSIRERPYISIATSLLHAFKAVSICTNHIVKTDFKRLGKQKAKRFKRMKNIYNIDK